MSTHIHSPMSEEAASFAKKLKTNPTIDKLNSLYSNATPIVASDSPALKFHVFAKCSTTKARASLMKLPHYDVQTPIFMPVGTMGTMKGLTTEQLQDLDCHIILGNTYHLGSQPGQEVIEKAQ
ncbi:hypothetical protein BB561_007033, partial [Smittium simulii]